MYELKMDGIRCLIYIENQTVDIRNKRNVKLLPKFPEMKHVFQQVTCDCILDGELYYFHQGTIDFSIVQKRALLNDPFKIQLASQNTPITFTAFDILYYQNTEIIHLPLLERKQILSKCIKETNHFNVSRYISTFGISLFQQTVKQNLEGVVAKKKNSLYHPNTRTTQWIKIKHLLDDDFVVVGYLEKEQGIHLVLAQCSNQQLIYIGQVLTSKTKLPTFHKSTKTLFDIKNVIWINPYLVCRVKFMQRFESGSLRQPIFVDFIYDKDWKECTFPK
ncbi:MAG: RNA ligase family protein [Erysipelotrichaceae bacterium]|nr:RNA ligase family protein [Erysipelotrichaceae bacterium]